MRAVIWAGALVAYMIGSGLYGCDHGISFVHPFGATIVASIALFAEAVCWADDRAERRIAEANERKRLGLSPDEMTLLAEYRKDRP